jgi:REP element-mobilizing transposase RayT
MRTHRIKIAPEEGEAVYHCLSRTVNGEWLFDDPSKEVLRKHLWQVADFCGVRIVTYTLVSNHFHIFVRIPKKLPVPDAELLRRYRVLHPHPNRHQAARLAVIEHWLAKNTPEGEAWRQRIQKLMGDVSAFMKLFKQRYSIWFNRSHNRFGTLWAERFKSVLVEASEGAVRTIAAYIDLNCVRAGIVVDPKDYRFCGYAEAVAGNELMREGLGSVCGESTWEKNQAAYRQVLFGTGAGPREKGATISAEDCQRVLAEGGKLSLSEVLRCRVRYFTDGAVLGSQAFVQKQLGLYQARTGRRQGCGPKVIPLTTDWGELTMLRGLRGQALG